MDEQLKVILASLTRPNLFPLRKGEQDEMSRMKEVIFPVKQRRGHLLHCPGNKKGTPKALLIHGWGGNPFMLKPQKDALQELGFDIYMPFLLGHDPASPEACSLAEQVPLMLELQDRIGGFDIVIAHSAGGIISALSATQGFVVNKLILLASPCSFPALLEHKLKASTSASDLYVALYDNYAKEPAKLPALMCRKVYSNLDADVLIIHGTADRKIPYEDACCIHRELPQSRMMLVANAGHLGILHHETTRQAIAGHLHRLAYQS